jgi:hypothetical protein
VRENGLKTEAFVRSRVAGYYWRDDINCAATTLKILAEYFAVPLADQVIDAATGLHGAGEYGAQCGLVEGPLMFLGILGRSQAIPGDAIVSACRSYAEGFESRFGSLSCAVLRPAGFDPRNPPHLCEDLTCEAVALAIECIAGFAKRVRPSQTQDGSRRTARRPCFGPFRGHGEPCD